MGGETRAVFPSAARFWVHALENARRFHPIREPCGNLGEKGKSVILPFSRDLARRFCFELTKQNLPIGRALPSLRHIVGARLRSMPQIHPPRRSRANGVRLAKSVVLARAESLARRFCFELTKQNLPILRALPSPRDLEGHTVNKSRGFTR